MCGLQFAVPWYSGIRRRHGQMGGCELLGYNLQRVTELQGPLISRLAPPDNSHRPTVPAQISVRAQTPCFHIDIHIYIYTHTCTCIHMDTHTDSRHVAGKCRSSCMCTTLCICTYASEYVQLHVHSYLHAHVHTCIHTHPPAERYALHAHMHIYMFLLPAIYIYI